MLERNGNIKIFAGSSGERFAQRMCAYLEIEMGKHSIRSFQTEISMSREESIRGDKDVYIVQPIAKNLMTNLRSFIWIDAFKRASATP